MLAVHVFDVVRLRPTSLLMEIFAVNISLKLIYEHESKKNFPSKDLTRELERTFYLDESPE